MTHSVTRIWTFLLTVMFAATCALGVCQPEPDSASPTAAASTVEWVTREVKAPRVSFHTFDSAAAKTKVSYHLYTPAAYDAAASRDRRFPVVYWLHGSGGGLSGIPQVARHFDEAIAAGKTPPCLVVFVNGLVEGMYVDWKDGTAPLETVIVKDLVPHIDATYHTIATREGRLLDGFSMGGYGAARLGFKFPDMFRAVSIVGAGPMQEELVQTPRAGRQRAAEVLSKCYGGDQTYFRAVSPRTLAEQNAERIAKSSLVRMIVGDKDETFENNRLFHEHLDALKIPHTWTVLPGVAHDPMDVLRAVGDENWTFYRTAFGEATGRSSAAQKSEMVLSFKIKDQDRRAVVVNAPTDGTTRPAVIVLHGGMGSAQDMRAKSGFDAVANANGFMVVYAEGTDFGGDRHAWNTGYLLRLQVKGADDIAYFDTLIDTLIRDHGADPTRVYMTGGSNGGMMTFVYAVARPHKLAAIAPVVASMFTFDTVPAVPLSILIINGAKDEEVPLEGGMSRNHIVRRAQEAPYKPLKDVVQFWVRANKSLPEPKVATVGTVTTTTHDAGPGGAVTEFVVDSVGGHGWPGSRSRRDGNAPLSSFSGAERVWTFFKQHTRKPHDGPADKSTPATTPAEPSKPALAPSTSMTRSVKVGTLDRRSLIYIPRGYDPSRPTPVVVVFHGGGGNPETMVTFSGLNDTADEAGFIVAYPYGTGRLPNRLLTFNGGNCCGYAMDNNIDDVAFTRALLDDLATVANVDANRIYATGMSNGGIMAYRVASELADRFAAIAPVGGPMGTDTCKPSRPVAVMHFHGTADAHAPFNGGQGVGNPLTNVRPVFLSVRHSLDQWIKANSCAQPPEVVQLPDAAPDGMTVKRTTWGGGKDGTEVVLIEITGGGHTWPGREPHLDRLGPSTKDISANDLMWEFFKKHARTHDASPRGSK